jgi:hypothetical protein
VLDVATLKRSLAATTDCDGDELNAFVGLLYVRAPRHARLTRTLL